MGVRRLRKALRELAKEYGEEAVQNELGNLPYFQKQARESIRLLSKHLHNNHYYARSRERFVDLMDKPVILMNRHYDGSAFSVYAVGCKVDGRDLHYRERDGLWEDCLKWFLEHGFRLEEDPVLSHHDHFISLEHIEKKIEYERKLEEERQHFSDFWYGDIDLPEPSGYTLTRAEAEQLGINYDTVYISTEQWREIEDKIDSD